MPTFMHNQVNVAIVLCPITWSNICGYCGSFFPFNIIIITQVGHFDIKLDVIDHPMGLSP